MEVDVDGTLSYPKPQVNGNVLWRNPSLPLFPHPPKHINTRSWFSMALLFLFFLSLNTADSRPKPINIEEEQFMRVFYENKLQEVCTNFHFPHKVQVCGLLF